MNTHTEKQIISHQKKIKKIKKRLAIINDIETSLLKKMEDIQKNNLHLQQIHNLSIEEYYKISKNLISL